MLCAFKNAVKSSGVVGVNSPSATIHSFPAVPPSDAKRKTIGFAADSALIPTTAIEKATARAQKVGVIDDIWKSVSS